MYSKLIGHPPGPSALRDATVVSVSELAQAQFWYLLSDYAHDQVKLPFGWQSVGPEAPFLAVIEGVVRVALPAI